MSGGASVKQNILLNNAKKIIADVIVDRRIALDIIDKVVLKSQYFYVFFELKAS